MNDETVPVWLRPDNIYSIMNSRAVGMNNHFPPACTHFDLYVQFLGLHLHTDDTSGHNHSNNEHEEGTQDYVYKMLVVIGGIYCFYLMETVFALITHKHNEHHHGVRG